MSYGNLTAFDWQDRTHGTPAAGQVDTSTVAPTDNQRHLLLL
jgi:hypothetical protein